MLQLNKKVLFIFNIVVIPYFFPLQSMTKPLLASTSTRYSSTSSSDDSLSDDDEMPATSMQLVTRNVDSYTYSRSLVNVARDTQPHCDYLMQALIFLSRYPHPFNAAGLREKLHAMLNNERTLKWEKKEYKDILTSFLALDTPASSSSKPQYDPEKLRALNDVLRYKLCESSNGELSEEQFSLIKESTWLQYNLDKSKMISVDDMWKMPNEGPVDAERFYGQLQEESIRKGIFLYKRLLVSCANLISFVKCFSRKAIQLDSLTMMYLQDNNLKELPDTIFTGLPALEILDVSNNPIESFPQKAGVGGKKIKKILARQTKLVRFPRAGFPALEELEITDTPLRFISLAQKGLRILKLGRNNLHGVVVSPSCDSLVTIELPNNALEYLPDDFLKGNTSVKTLDLRGNAIRELSQDLILGKAGYLTKLQKPEFYPCKKVGSVSDTTLVQNALTNIKMVFFYDTKNDTESQRRMRESDQESRNAVATIRQRPRQQLKILTRAPSISNTPLTVLRYTDGAYLIEFITENGIRELMKFPHAEDTYFEGCLRYAVTREDSDLKIVAMPLYKDYEPLTINLREEYKLPASAKLAHPVCINRSGTYFLVKGINSFYMYEKDKSEALCKLKSKGNDEKHCLAIHPTKKNLAIAYNKGIELWDFEENSIIKYIPNVHHQSITKIEYTKDGAYLIVQSKNWTVKLLDALTGFEVAVFYGIAPIKDVFYESSRQQLIVSFTEKKPVRVFDIKTKKVFELRAGLDQVFGCTFAEGAYMVVGRSPVSELLEVWTYENSSDS